MRQCRLRRRLWVYLVGVMILRRRAVVSGWRSRLTSVAWVAPAAALCALVTRGQQYSLAKVTSGSTTERTFVYRVKCGRWASLPGEVSRPRARVPPPADTWRLRTPPGGVPVSSPLRGPDSMWGSGTPWEVRGPRPLCPEGFLHRDMWRHRTCPEREAGSVPLVW